MAEDTVTEPHILATDTPLTHAPAAGSAIAPSADGDGSANPQCGGKTGLSDAFREHFSGGAPLAEKAKSFAKTRPWVTAALAGIAGIAILNSLRGKRD